MAGVLAGAAMYAHHDVNFSAVGYFWVACAREHTGSPIPERFFYTLHMRV